MKRSNPRSLAKVLVLALLPLPLTGCAVLDGLRSLFPSSSALGAGATGAAMASVNAAQRFPATRPIAPDAVPAYRERPVPSPPPVALTTNLSAFEAAADETFPLPATDLAPDWIPATTPTGLLGTGDYAEPPPFQKSIDVLASEALPCKTRWVGGKGGAVQITECN